MNRGVVGLLQSYYVALLAALGAASAFVFFAFSGLIGYSYPGIEDSSAFLKFNVVVALLIALLFGKKVIATSALKRGELFVLVFIFCLLSLHIVWHLLSPESTDIFPRNLALFFVEAIPGAIAGFLVVRARLWRQFASIMIVFGLVFLVAATKENLLPLLLYGDVVRGVGGHQYQVTSYYAAFSAGLVLAGWQFLDHTALPRMVRGILWTPSVILLVLVALAVILHNAGRGAFLLLVLYLAFAIFMRIKEPISVTRLRLMKPRRKVIILLMLPVILVTAMPVLLQVDRFQQGLNRALAYVDLSGDRIINLEEGSSGRDRVYQRNFDAIYDSPLVGYGPFDHWETAGRPHNFFFEIVIQFGIPLAGVVLLGLAFFLAHVARVRHDYKLFVLFMGMFPLVNLQLSTTYLWHSVFWFCLAALLAMPSRAGFKGSP